MGHRRVFYIHQSVPNPAAIADQGATNFAVKPRLSRVAATLVAFWLSVNLGGCSFAIAPLLGDSDSTTASSKANEPISSALDTEDWRRAKAAMAVALDPKGNGNVVHWDNPTTAANGAFTPLGEAYSVGGRICRSFAAEVTTQALGQHLQGEACRGSAGEWTVSMINDAPHNE
jgi:surface antigen